MTHTAGPASPPNAKPDAATPEGAPRTAPLVPSVGATVTRLQQDLLTGPDDRRSAARGVLARLRRRVGRRVAQDPLALEETLMVLSPALREEELWEGGAASPSERAAYHALTFFALHMQGATAPVHVPDRSFARACGELRARRELNANPTFKSLKPRVDAMLMTRVPHSRLIHLRSLIALLRDEKIGFDYGRLAGDLRALENPHWRNGVLLRWGRDFALGSYPRS